MQIDTPKPGRDNTRPFAGRLPAAPDSCRDHGPLAQLVEHLTFNQVVAGSNPARPTTPHVILRRFQ